MLVVGSGTKLLIFRKLTDRVLTVPVTKANPE